MRQLRPWYLRGHSLESRSIFPVSRRTRPIFAETLQKTNKPIHTMRAWRYKCEELPWVSANLQPDYSFLKYFPTMVAQASTKSGSGLVNTLEK